MDRPKFDMLIELVNEYDDVEKEKIKRAFEYAKYAHQGQRREIIIIFCLTFKESKDYGRRKETYGFEAFQSDNYKPIYTEVSE